MLDPKKPEVIIICAHCKTSLWLFKIVQSCQGKVVSTKCRSLKKGLKDDINKGGVCPMCKKDFKNEDGYMFRTKDGTTGSIPVMHRRPQRGT